MNPLDVPVTPSRGPPAPPSASPSPSKPTSQPIAEPSSEDAIVAVGRLEQLLREVRGTLEARDREDVHQEFSIIRLLGVLCQMAAGGMLVWASIDWFFQPLLDQALVKAVFAGVLQLMALTSFVTSRPRH